MTSGVDHWPMGEPAFNSLATNAELRAVFPWLTLIALVLSLAFTAIYWVAHVSEDTQALLPFVIPHGYLIWRGWFWGLLTSVFVHGDPIHLAFNLYWHWHLGSRIEKAVGGVAWTMFFVVAAVASSGAQLAVSDETGIGLSGVVYAFFGFMWPTRSRYQTFRTFLNRQTVNLLIFWLGACVVMTWLKVWAIGNGAHVAGVLFGVLVAAGISLRWRPLFTRTALAALCVGCIFPAWWCPWSALWTAAQGDMAFDSNRDQAAIAWYEKSLRMGLKDGDWVLYNLGLLYYRDNDMSKFGETYDQLSASYPDFAAELRDELGIQVRERTRAQMLEDLKSGFSGDVTAPTSSPAPESQR